MSGVNIIPVRLLLADDHPIFAQGLAMLLTSADPTWRIEAIVHDGAEALSQITTLRPDLALLDLAMPKMSGLQVTGAVMASGIATRLLILSMYDDPALIEQAQQAGAIGYLLKEHAFEHLVTVVRMALTGTMPWVTSNPLPKAPLSTREHQVLQYIVTGQTNRAIAAAIGLSVKTIETYRARLMRKLGAHNTAQLLRQAHLWGITPIL